MATANTAARQSLTDLWTLTPSARFPVRQSFQGSRRRRYPAPIAGAAFEAVAAVGQEVVVVGTDTCRVPVGDRPALGVVDPVVVDLQVAGGAASGPHAAVAVALEDGRVQEDGDVAAVVGDAG